MEQVDKCICIQNYLEKRKVIVMELIQYVSFQIVFEILEHVPYMYMYAKLSFGKVHVYGQIIEYTYQF